MVGEMADISRLVSLVLRHEPWLYELELDHEGWLPIDVLAAIRVAEPRWSGIDRLALEQMIAGSSK